MSVLLAMLLVHARLGRRPLADTELAGACDLPCVVTFGRPTTPQASARFMKSSTGKHYLGLDHVRAMAAFMVFSWHFLHASNGYPVPFAAAPVVFPGGAAR
jgi:hypothetical protein